ncbi:MAG: hypothetical protein Fur0022_07270 [Anaerolineales bacterium]
MKPQAGGNFGFWGRGGAKWGMAQILVWLMKNLFHFYFYHKKMKTPCAKIQKSMGNGSG